MSSMLIVSSTPDPTVAAMRMAKPAARMRRIFLIAGFMGRLSPGYPLCPWACAGLTLVLVVSARGETAPHARFVATSEAPTGT